MPAPTSDDPPKLTREQATARAKQALADLHSKHDFVLQEALTQERVFGWAFFYTTRPYLTSHDPKDLVPGTGPLIVEGTTGETTFLTTSAPPKVVIDVWEREWRAKHGAAGR